MSVRSKVGTAVVVAGALWIGASMLQSPSDGVDRIKGTDRINRDEVLYTLKWSPSFRDGGPHTIAISYVSILGLTTKVDWGDDTASISPYTKWIKSVKKGKIAVSAVPAKRDGQDTFASLECWLHKGGTTIGHTGPTSSPLGCLVTAVVPAE